jgi:hypothetical protein
MKITFSPCRMDAVLAASIDGDTITLNGQAVDLSGVAEGAAVDAETLGCDWITGQVSRADGVLCVTLILPHGADAPQEALFPEPVEAGDGPVAVPGQEVADNE